MDSVVTSHIFTSLAQGVQGGSGPRQSIGLLLSLAVAPIAGLKAGLHPHW